MPKKKSRKKPAKQRSTTKARKHKGLSKKDVKVYKKLLLKRKMQLMEEFFHIKKDALNVNASQKDASGDLSGYSIHLADMASDQYERDFLLRLASDERNKLYAFDDAMKKVEEGTYGMCDTCKKSIGKKRLKAVPEASNCMKCQSEKEANSRR